MTLTDLGNLLFYGGGAFCLLVVVLEFWKHVVETTDRERRPTDIPNHRIAPSRTEINRRRNEDRRSY